MEDRTLTLIQEDGTEVACNILFTYYYEKTKKNYVVFQVLETEEVSAAVYYPEGANGKLDRVETEEEWAMLEELLEDYANRNQDEEEECGGHCASCGSCSGECDCDGECDCE